LTGNRQALSLDEVMARAAGELGLASPTAFDEELAAFVRDRLRHLFLQRGYRHAEIDAALGATDPGLSPLRTRWRLEALREVRGSAEFAALAELFKRVKNIARELGPHPLDAQALDRSALREPAEQALLAEFDRRADAIRAAGAASDYTRAMTDAAAFRAPVDRFFAEVFVMVDDPVVRQSRLLLLGQLRDLMLAIADISQLTPAPVA
jgi:glycyl-tRNA synthetase beta chain